MSYAQYGFERCVLGYGALSDSMQYLSIVVNACKLFLGRGPGISDTSNAKYWSRIDREWKDLAAHAPSTPPASCQIVGSCCAHAQCGDAGALFARNWAAIMIAFTQTYWMGCCIAGIRHSWHVGLSVKRNGGCAAHGWFVGVFSDQLWPQLVIY